MRRRGTAALTALVLTAGSAMGGVAEAAVTAAPKPGPQKWKLTGRTGVKGDDSLGALAVTGKKSAWAGGGVFVGHTPLLYRWNGSKWRRVKLPAKVDKSITDLDATSDKNVWAFGGDNDTSAKPAFKAFHWNGKSWKASVIERRDTYLWDAEVVSSSNVWLSVDDHGARGQLRHWNGRTWRAVRVRGVSRLYSLHFTSAKNGWAVGIRENGKGAIALHWNGSSWKPTTLPRIAMPKDASFSLSSVTALSPRNVWAVGSYIRLVGDDEVQHPVVLHWNGSKWRRQAGPAKKFDLSALAADGRGGLWMKGGVDWLVHYRSGRWSTVRFPGPSDSYVSVDAIANVPGTATMLGLGVVRPPGRPDAQDGAFFTAR
jgi:hypothetical protein